jgi:glutaredoxin
MPGCSWCDKAKELLTESRLAYREVVIGVDLPKEDFKVLFLGKVKVASVPQIFDGDTYIGGYAELKTHLANKHIETARRARASLRNGKWRVKFFKKDGTFREMVATTDVALLPEVPERMPDMDGTDNGTEVNDDLVTLYDLEAKGWRSFHAKNLVTLEFSA